MNTSRSTLTSPFSLIKRVPPFSDLELPAKTDFAVAPARVGPKKKPAVFPGWLKMARTGPRYNLFVFPLSHKMGMPPGVAAKIIMVLIKRTLKHYPHAAGFWIPVFSPSRWYRLQVTHFLEGKFWGRVALYITDGVGDLFTGDRVPLPIEVPVPEVAPVPGLVDLPAREQEILTTLRRLEVAYAADIAAHVGVSRPWANIKLNRLVERGYVRKVDGEQTHWQIKRNGVTLVKRGLGVPRRTSLKVEREQRTNLTIGNRHLHVSRRWPAWLEEALWYEPEAEIWAGWSECKPVFELGRLRPDNLAIGKYEGRETLFWLEVESGSGNSKSIDQVQNNFRKLIRRLGEHYLYRDYKIVFTLLGQPWVTRAAWNGKLPLYDHMAVVLEDWKQFGVLKRPRFDWVRSPTDVEV